VIVPIDYRRRARECLELANTATDVYVKVALTELAQEFDQAAAQVERSCVMSHGSMAERTDSRSAARSGTDLNSRNASPVRA